MIAESAMHLWGKAESDTWLPLYVHMQDVTATIRHLWKNWLPEHTRKQFIEGFNVDSADECENILAFLAASHDIGKATPAFQAMLDSDNTTFKNVIRENLNHYNFPFRTDLQNPHAIKHSFASQLIMERNGIDRTVAVIVGSHHGIPPTRDDFSQKKARPNNTGFNNTEWLNVQNGLFEYALELSHLDRNSAKCIKAKISAQFPAAGLLSLADWIGSNTEIFPLLPIDTVCPENSEKRIEHALGLIELSHRWMPPADSCGEFRKRFDYDPRPFQATVSEISSNMAAPGVIFIEAPTGEGKTEAALMAAEHLAEKFGCGGVVFALPTQATADGIFGRFKDWMEKISSDNPQTLFLAHGRSKFNNTYRDLPRQDWGRGMPNKEKVFIHSWFTGPKKGLLSDFCVGTVDQILMCGLKQRYGQMRHLALSNKIVVVDECHAYDAYMGSYLCKALEWLGAYKVPVILMSATMPPGRKTELLNAYYSGEIGRKVSGFTIHSPGYPLITTACDGLITETVAESTVKGKNVTVEWNGHDSIADIIQNYNTENATVGVILNTVRRAQETYSDLKKELPEADILLIHSRFTCFRRSELESAVLERAGKNSSSRGNNLTIIVGTQVIEQSLDIDFDLLLTDICPVDLLIQRIGRLHRHERTRPSNLSEPHCVILDDRGGEFEKGTEYIYQKLHLYNTRSLVNEIINIPDDVPHLVSSAYGGTLEIPADLAPEYAEAKQENKLLLNKKETKAGVFQLKDPWKCTDLVSLLDNSENSLSDECARATVRDIDGSIEVILVGLHEDGTFFDIESGETIPSDSRFTEKNAFRMTGSKISLPARFSRPEFMGKTLSELQMISAKEPSSWKDHGWISEELILFMDENLKTELLNTKMEYDQERGLFVIE